MGRSRDALEASNGVGLAEIHGVDTIAPPSYPSLENVINNVPRSNPPPAPKKQARAFWDYNLDSEVRVFFLRFLIFDLPVVHVGPHTPGQTALIGQYCPMVTPSS